MAKPSPGQPLPRSATLWGNIIESADDYALRRRLGETGDRKQGVVATDIIKVKNSSGAARRAGDMLELSGFLLTTVEKQYLWFDGAEPDATRPFVILREQSPPDAITDAHVSGACRAYVNVTDTDHGYAAPSSGLYVLQSAESGPVRILYKPSGTGEKLCAIVIGAGASAATGERTAWAALTAALAPTDATASVGSVEALDGGTAPSVGNPQNYFRMAGKIGDYVELKYRTSTTSWYVSEVRHQVATLVLKHSGDGVFLKYDAVGVELDGCVIASSSIVSAGTEGYETQLDVYPCS